MNLQHLAKPTTSQEYANTLSSQTGVKYNFDLPLDRAITLLSETRNVIDRYRKSTKLHTSETNPVYLQTLIMEKALTAKVKELQEADAGSFGGVNKQAGKSMKQIVPGKTYANALKKTAMGEDISDKEWTKLRDQNISENLLKVLENREASVKLMKKIVESRRVLKEDEVENAQIVLAAQDMVDRIQKMIEDMVDLQYKDVPALADTMATEMGIDKATTFKDSMGNALGSLADQLNSSKTEMQKAVAIVTGEEVAGEMGELEGVDQEPEMDTEMPAEPEMDMEPEMDDEEVVPMPDEEDFGLGRERR